MKKSNLLILPILFFLIFTKTAFAKEASNTGFGRLNQNKVAAQEARDEKKITTQAAKDEKKLDRLEFKQELKDKISSKVAEIKNKVLLRIILNDANVTATGASTLTVEKDGTAYTINITDKTKIVRRFFGKATLADIKVGHKILVVGKRVAENSTTIDAVLIRDLSIQKRFGAFVGTVTGITGDSFTLNTVARGVQKALVGTTTKFVNRKNVTITKADVLVGHRIRVKGTWDSSVNTITEITQVKDYDLPVRATGSTGATVSVTPTSTLTPTVTPTPTATPTPTPTP